MLLSRVFQFILSTIFMTELAVACLSRDGNGFLPKNNLKIATTFVRPGLTMTESTFNRVISEMEKIYKPIMALDGRDLLIHRLWNNENVNASAFKQKKDTKIHEIEMYGGLARHPAMTEDGFALVLCHELGHHLGGAPYTTMFWGKASNEGQADYFAVTKCIRKYFEYSQSRSESIDSEVLPSIVNVNCLSSWGGNSKEYKTCIRSAHAAQSLANLFSAVSRSITQAEFDTPSEKIVSTTYNNHPEAQCRLDTYFQGSLCQVAHNVSFNFTEERTGACVNYNQEGARPKCWFKPQFNEGLDSGGFQNRRI